MNYVFDVDGTLTPSRGKIDAEFAEWFSRWIENKNVFLVSGSDYAKTIEQLGEDICNSVDIVYSCAGNAVYMQGALVSKSDFAITREQRLVLLNLLHISEYPTRTGQHIEERIGLCNFSVVGRGATAEQRQDYYEYDQKTNERFRLAANINAVFPDLEATVAGETGIDIYRRGCDKSQIANSVTPFVFFGDMIKPGGNDYSLAQYAQEYHCVESWRDTWTALKEKYND
jgi:phosphomannomutase